MLFRQTLPSYNWNDYYNIRNKYYNDQVRMWAEYVQPFQNDGYLNLSQFRYFTLSSKD